MKLSVLTPSYNASIYLDRAIKSVLNQDYNDWEHIIVDGGSDDDSVSILKRYDHLIWVSEKDKGQSDAMNKAFERSSGDIVVYLNADDYFERNIFARVVDAFTHDQKIDMVVGNLRVLYAKERRSYIQHPSVSLDDIVDFSKQNVFPFNPVSYFYKREVQERVGKFPIENTYTMDLWFLLRAYSFSKIKKVDDVFGVFYIDGNNKTSNLYESIISKFEVVSSFVKESANHDYDAWLYKFAEGYARDKIALRAFEEAGKRKFQHKLLRQIKSIYHSLRVKE